MLCINGLHQRLPELVERHEGFLAFKVTIAIQRTDYTICNHFKDKVFPDETAIFMPVRCRAVPCAAFGIPVVVAYRFCNGAEYIYTESGIFKQKRYLSFYHQVFPPK